MIDWVLVSNLVVSIFSLILQFFTSSRIACSACGSDCSINDSSLKLDLETDTLGFHTGYRKRKNSTSAAKPAVEIHSKPVLANRRGGRDIK
jgi:hypothetical protein